MIYLTWSIKQMPKGRMFYWVEQPINSLWPGGASGAMPAGNPRDLPLLFVG